MKDSGILPGVTDVIRERWSPRAYSSREVTAADLQLLFEAARWAASCNNEQPWRFLVATKAQPEQHAKIVGILVEANAYWARHAPVLMLTVAKRTFTPSGAGNIHALHDAGLALANLMIQATAMGLHAHAMAGFHREKARTEFGIPEDYELGTVVAIGYQGDPGALSEKHRAAELGGRKRKTLREVVYSAEWESPLEF